MATTYRPSSPSRPGSTNRTGGPVDTNDAASTGGIVSTARRTHVARPGGEPVLAPTLPAPAGIDPRVRVGHVNLRVAELSRATAFYRDVLGFAVTVYGPDFGLPAVFLAAGGYHHHVALNTWTSEGGTAPPQGHTGLHHLALVFPHRTALARAVRRLVDHRYPIDGAEDHGATVSVYLRDPDGNGIELYYDRPRKAWFDTLGRPIVKAEPFDPRDLLDPAPEAVATRRGSRATVHTEGVA